MKKSCLFCFCCSHTVLKRTGYKCRDEQLKMQNPDRSTSVNMRGKKKKKRADHMACSGNA